MLNITNIKKYKVVTYGNTYNVTDRDFYFI